MRVLHILRSEPTELVRALIRGSFAGFEVEQVRLDEGDVDYDKLVQSIFASERVVCWW